MKKPLRFRQDAKNPELSKLARDVQEALDSTVDYELKDVVGEFTSNTTIAVPRVPRAIELINCFALAAPETPVLYGSRVNFVYRPQSGGALVTGIEGLTTGTTIYQFLFRISY